MADKIGRKDKLAIQVSVALAAGVFSIMPVAQGSPVLDKVVSGGAVVKTGTTTTVTSQVKNNVINWKDFSAAKGETIQFDGGQKTNNYLNVVTGATKSQINGKIEGGNDVYIVNPKGVVFGKDAEVDVGHLYASTRPIADVDTTGFAQNGTSPLASTATTPAGDVVNLGKIQAASVSVEGNTIRFVNTADIQDANGNANNNVTLKVSSTAADAISLGYEKNAAAPTYTMTDMSGTAKTSKDYTAIATMDELQAINTDNMAGNYWLAKDLDMSQWKDSSGNAVTNFTPIGSASNPFTGTFDGNYFTISNLQVTDGTAGLFGVVGGNSASRAVIRSVGLVNPTVLATTGYAAGIAANVSYADISGVYVKGGTVTAKGKPRQAGGLLGYAKNATLEQAYNTATLGAYGAGIVNNMAGNVTVRNVYNAGTAGFGFGYTFSGTDNTVEKSYYDTSKSPKEFYLTNGTPTDTKSSVGITFGQAGDANTKKTTFSNLGWSISNVGGENTIWRIYEGQSLPLLRCFLTANGTAAVNYNYNYFDKKTGALDPNGLTTAGNLSGSSTGADLTATYNGNYLKFVDDTTNNNTSSPMITYGSASASDVTQNSNVSSGFRNAGSYTMFYTGQDGYDLVGNNLTIDPKTINLGNQKVSMKQVYDGTTTVNVGSLGTAVGIIAGDDAAVGGLTATLSKKDVGNYTSAAGTVKIANASGTVSITGTDAANYTLNQSSIGNLQLDVTVEKRTLYIKANQSSIDKVYDGTSALASGSPTASSAIGVDTTNTTMDSRGYASGLVTGDPTPTVTASGSSGYVDANGNATAQATNNTANNAGATAVRFTGLSLSDTNYQLGYIDPTTKQSVTGVSFVDVAGKINQRVLDPTKFVVKDAQGNTITATKTYDGTTGYTLASGSTVSAGKENGNQGLISTNATSATAQDSDFDRIYFTAASADFLDANGQKTSDASQSGYSTAATQIGYNLTAGVSSGTADVLGNYTLNGQTLDNGTTQYTVQGAAGTINRRNINVALQAAYDKAQTTNPTSIDKVYDADAAVDSAYNTFANTNLPAGAPASPVGYASGSDQLVSDQSDSQAPTMTVTGQYLLKGNEGKAENVLLDSNGNPTTKNIQFDVVLSGAHAQNYELNGTAVTAASSNPVSISGAQGIISKRDMLIAFTNTPKKTYDTTQALTTADQAAIAVTLDDGANGTIIAKDNAAMTTASIKAQYQSPNAGATPVEYSNLLTAFGSNTQNYNLVDKSTNAQVTSDSDTVLGAGQIDPLKIKSIDVEFSNISRVYNGSDAVNYTYLDASGKPVAVSAQDFFKDAYVYPNGTSGGKLSLKSDMKAVDWTQGSTTYTHFASAHSGNGTAQNVTYVFDLSSLYNKSTQNMVIDPNMTGWNQTTKQLTVTQNAATKSTLQGTITPRAVGVTAIGSQSKVYDAGLAVKDAQGNVLPGTSLTTMAQTQQALTPLIADTQEGLVMGDGSSNATTAAYQDKNVGTKNKVIDYNLAVDTAHAGDYTFYDATKTGKAATTTLQTTDNTITPAPLTLTAAQIHKIYDGNTDTKDANGTELQTANNKINLKVTPIKGDTVNVNYAKASYSSPNVLLSNGGNVQDVIYDGLTLTGTDAGNYYLTDGTNALAATTTQGLTGFTTLGATSGVFTGIIDPAAITANDVYFTYTGVTKTYDGNSTVTSTGTYGDARDYVQDHYFQLGNTKQNFAYTINPNGANYVNASGTNDEHAKGTATNKGVRYQVTVTPKVSSNYTLTAGTGSNNGVTIGSNGTITIDKILNVGHISPKDVTVTSSPYTKTYDATTAVPTTTTNPLTNYIQFNGLVSTDGSSNQSTAVFVDSAQGANDAKNVSWNNGTVASDKSITYTLAVDTAHQGDYVFYDAANYTPGATTNQQITTYTSKNNTINPATLALIATPIEKVYDGTTATKNTQGTELQTTGHTLNVKTSTPLGSDKVGVTYASASYTSPNVIRLSNSSQYGWQDVIYDGVQLTGTDAGNYYLTDGTNALQATTTQGLTGFTTQGATAGRYTGVITPATLTADAVKFDFAGVTKVYDGTSAVTSTKGPKNDATDYVTQNDIQITGGNVQTIPYQYTVTKAEYVDAQKNGDPHVGTSKDVRYQIALSSQSLNNYDFQKNTKSTDGTVTIDNNGAITIDKTLSFGTITPKDITVTFGADTKTYDTTRNTKAAIGSLVSMNGIVNQQDAGNISVTGLYTTKNAGTNKQIDYTFTLNPTIANDYTINGQTLTAGKLTLSSSNNTINQAPLTLTAAAIEKVYDGTTYTKDNQGTLTGTGQELQTPGHLIKLSVNPLTGDTVNVAYTSAEYTSPNVIRTGTNTYGSQDVIYDGIQLSGADAGNYYLTDGTNALAFTTSSQNAPIYTTKGATSGVYQGVITPASITANDVKFDFAGVTKVYDGTAAVVSTNGTNKDATDYVTQNVITPTTGAIQSIPYQYTVTDARYIDASGADDPHAGTSKGVRYQITLTPAALNNYDFVNGTSTDGTVTAQNGVITIDKTKNVGTITPKDITVQIAANTKTYDGTTNTYDGTTNTGLSADKLVSLTGRAQDNAALTVTGSYADKNAGSNKVINYTVTLDAAHAGDYTFNGTAYQTGGMTYTTQNNTINKRTLGFDVDRAEKDYDGKSDLTGFTNAHFTNLASGETLTLDKDAVKLINGQYGIYDETTGTFTPDANVNRDATTNAVLDKAVGYTNLQQAFQNAKGTALQSNYTIANTAYFTEAQAKGRIRLLAITADAIHEKWKDISKTYDATTTVNDAADKLRLYTTLLDGSELDIGYTLTKDGANYTQKDQGTGITVNYVLAGITEPDFRVNPNYTMTDETRNSFVNKTYSMQDGVITKKQLHVTQLATTGQNKVYDGTRNADPDNIVIEGIEEADKNTVKAATTAYYDTKNVGKDKTITYKAKLSGNDKGNYTLDQEDFTATGDITKRKLYVDFKDGAVEGIDKTYDGTTDIDGDYSKYIAITTTGGGTGLVGNDKASIGEVQAHYADANVQRDSAGNITTQDVYFTNFNLTGDDADNYELETTSLTGKGTITPRTIEVSLKDAPTKVYDGTTDITGTYASASNINVDKTNLVKNDTVNVSLKGTPSYETKHTGKKLGVDYALSWDNGNYTLVHTKLNAADTQTVTSNDANQTAALHADNGTISGRVLTVAASTAAEKVYDGTDAVNDAASHFTISNLSTGDTISDLGFTATGTYSSANAADSESEDTTDRTVTYNLAILNTDYILEEPTVTGTGVIHRKGLTVTAEPVSRLQYDLRGLPTSYNGSVTGWVSGEEGQSSAFSFHTDPKDNVTTNIPGNYGIYGWYNGATSGNYGQNYTFDQAASNATAFEVVNLKEYHDRITPGHQKTTTNAGYTEAAPSDFGAFYRKPAETIAYSGGTSTGAIQEAANRAVSGETGSISGSQAYASTNPGNQATGQIAIENTNVVNIDAAEAVNLQSDEITVENTDNGAGIAIYADSPDGEIAITNEA